MECGEYSPIKERILIVKLGARGDVLRTTALLEPLRRKYPESEIVWLVAPVSAPLLKNIPSIDQVWELGFKSMPRLAVEEFDIVLNLDLSPVSCALATKANARTRLGFGLDAKGRVYPFDSRGDVLLMMSLRDDLKKSNRKTYQQLMMDVLGLKGESGKIQVYLTEKEKEFAAEFADRLGLGSERPVFGINVGAGGRWKNKCWKFHHMMTLAEKVYGKYQTPIILLGGKDEAQRIAKMQEESTASLLSSGTDNTLREFMAIMSLCDLVITGDTMALHIALALGKKAVALFGPTSEAEIEMYGQGLKLTADMDCLCCYHEDCDKSPDCMELLSPDQVFEAIKTLLAT